jgi:hypothetical protein
MPLIFKYEDDSLLGYCIMWCVITLMMEAVRTGEISVYFYENTEWNISEGFSSSYSLPWEPEISISKYAVIQNIFL